MKVKEFELVNEAKVERALNGSQVADGRFVGGVRKEDGTFDDNALLAEYDKLGGLIMRGADKVKTGSFYDFANRRPLKEPKVVFTFLVNGKFIDVEDGTELPGIVKAAKVFNEEAKEAVSNKAEKKIKRRK